MSPPDQKTLHLARTLRLRLAAPALTPAQAKLYSQFVRLSLKQQTLRSFSRTDALQRLGEARMLITAALWERQSPVPTEWRKGIKRAGELFEWLSHEEILGKEYPVKLLAGAAYQIAGYPALARGFLTHIANADSSTLLTLTFKAAFPEVLEACLELLARVDRIGPTPGAEKPETFEATIEHAAIIETARSLAVIACFMRWGEAERLEAAIGKLADVASLCRYSQIPMSGIVAELCAHAALEFRDASIWRSLAGLSASSSDRVKKAFDRFGRRSFLQRRSLTWPSQVVGIERLLTGESFLLCTPTGSGKTTIAELAILRGLMSDPAETKEVAPLAVYLVPSRALASEVEQRLAVSLSEIAPDPVVVTGLYGGTDWGPTDAWLTSTDPTLLICTYEKAEALLRFLGPIFLRRLSLVVIDEAHSVQFDGGDESLRNAESRSLRLEALIVRLFGVLSARPYQLIGLSAVTAGTENALSQWLVSRPGATPARSDYRSTRQLIGKLECLQDGHVRIQYDLVDRASLQFSESGGDLPYVPDPFPPHPPVQRYRDNLSSQLKPYLVWSALNLAQITPDGQGQSVLVSITQHITRYAKDFLDIIKEQWKNEKLPQYFAEPTDIKLKQVWSECIETARDYFTDASVEVQLLRRGIVVHHGKMPAPLARRLKDVIERRIVRVVLATSTLTEGVNLPVEFILVPSLERNGTDPISPQEFLNLVGRAGRPGAGTEGKTLVLLPPDPGKKMQSDAAKKRWRLRKVYEELISKINISTASKGTKASSPIERLLQILREGFDSITGGTSTDAAFSEWLEQTEVVGANADGRTKPAMDCLDSLDGILLAAIEEVEVIKGTGRELSPLELEAELKDIWNRTYARVVSSNEETLRNAFVRRGMSIPDIYPIRSERRQIYKTSLPPVSARELLARLTQVQEFLKTGNDYALWKLPERLGFVQQLVELLSGIRRFSLPLKFRKSNIKWQEVLYWWLDPYGSSKKPSPDQIAKWHDYASVHFTYKINWALGSIVALALDNVSGSSAPVSLSLNEWSKSGLPWIAFWIKELLTWGTHEPVAAYLLALNRAITRKQAESYSQGYYLENGGTVDADSLLDPRKIRDWVNNTYSGRSENAGGFDDDIPATLPVKLKKEAGAFKQKQIRVFPFKFADETQWLDIAGYHVASSPPDPESLAHQEKIMMDYVLDVPRAIVSMTRYL